MSAFSDPAFVASIAGELASGRPVALASVLAAHGSMPRREGARMAMLLDGSLLGTVGGGALELMATERCREALGGAAPSLGWVDGDRGGMACGGSALLAVRLLGTRDAAAVSALSDVLAAGGEARVTEDWGTDASSPSLELGGGVPRHASWDGERGVYVEPARAPERLHLFGAGHVGCALVPLAASVGFEVRVYDDRPDLMAPEQLPWAASLACGPFGELAASADIGPRDSVVVLTHGHRADELVLRSVLAREDPPAYVGCIGSARKAALARRHLLEGGADPARVDRVRMPIGEAIGAETPSEIAVSIAAELIRFRSERREGNRGDAAARGTA